MINMKRSKIFKLLAVLQILLFLSSCIDNQAPRGRKTSKERSGLTEEAVPTPEPTPEVIERPDGAFYLERDYCACQDKKSVILSGISCQSFCSGKTTTDPYLYLNTRISSEIEANSLYGGKLSGWCQAIIDQNADTPKCIIEATWGSEKIIIEEVSISAAGVVTAPLTKLDVDKTYSVKIVEQSSGASSADSIHIKRIDTSSTTDPEEPLKIDPIHQYRCVTRVKNTNTNGDIVYIASFFQHFYFTNKNKPPVLPPGRADQVYCHDITVSPNDSESQPRLQLVEGAINLWSQSDTRMHDQDADQQPDINKILADRYTAEGVAGNANTFAQLAWFFYPANGFDQETSGEVNTLPPAFSPLGFMMVPFVKSGTNEGYCPKQTDFIGPNKVYSLMADIVGGDTEGLYLGVKEKETYSYTDPQTNTTTTANGLDDFVLIREAILKQIWFYYDNSGMLIQPDETTVNNETIYFYYPPDTSNPYIKKAHQRTYTIRHPNDLSTANGSGIPTNVIPGDKRFGCIPAAGTN